MPHFHLSDVSHAFGSRLVLSHVTLDLAEHRIAIIGHNGGGKSTLARLLNGLVTPTSGTVTLDGKDVNEKATKARSRVGFIFPDADNQIIMPTVFEDVAFTLRRSGIDKAEVTARVTAILERFGLQDHHDASPYTLSGGQKQLLALASVLIGSPDTVIADEPTTLLDLANQYLIRHMLTSLEQQVICVTHDLELAALCPRVIRVDSGRVIADGTPDEVIPAYRADMAVR